ncbi:MAG: carbohydrate ABC transporter permease [Thermomicrobiales bacterium]|nr:carbohydrate ABC transporter permease [Thermomicrobiales bacterium]MCO5222937.1 carbohydrate ABC transporter permease [Thermomicrobiales bacterium]
MGSRAIGRAFWTAVVAVVCALFLLPLAWAISTSLRATGAPLPRQMEWWPSPVVWRNYQTVFEIIDAARFALNSVIVVSVAVPVTVIFASLAGFAMSQLPLRYRGRLVAFSALCLMVPLTAIWIPRFLLFKEAGLMNRRGALMVPALMGTSPFFVLLFLWAFLTVPKEVYDAARLDGAGAYRIWAGIGLPQARGAIGTVAVLAFVHYWNSFVEPLLLMRTADKFTASLGLRMLYSLESTNWPIIMAGALLTVIPVVAVFVLAQHAFLRELRSVAPSDRQ